MQLGERSRRANVAAGPALRVTGSGTSMSGASRWSWVPRRSWLIGAVIVLVPVVVSQIGAYLGGLAIAAATTAILIESVGVVTDRAGMVVLCPMSFAAIGAWAVGYLNAHGWPGGFILWLIAGGFVAVPFGVLVGVPALRLRGIQLAVITLSFAAVTDSVFTFWGFPGQLQGAYVNRPGLFNSGTAYFVLCWLVFVVISGGMWFVARRPLGSSWLAIARSERATAAMGISVPRAKLTAFIISALIAGLAGGLFVGYAGTAVESQFAPLQSLIIVAVAVMVGGGNPDGALLGGVLSQAIPAVFRATGVSSDVANVFFAFGALMALKAGVSASGAWRLSARRRWRQRLGQDQHSATAAAELASWESMRRLSLDSAADRPALEIVGLSVVYGRVHALDSVDLTVPTGCVAGLIGPNGAGKSSLVDAVSGFISGYQGTIRVDGQALDALPVHRRTRVGVRRTFQTEHTIPELTVGRYVLLAGRGRMSPGEVEDLLRFLDGPDIGSTIADIDVGARQILELAGTLAARPRILLLDEPTAGLAEAESVALAERISAIPQLFGCSVLLIEHDIAVVRAACTQVSVLDFGRLIAHGPTAEVLAQPIVAEAYLGGDVAVGVS